MLFLKKINQLFFIAVMAIFFNAGFVATEPFAAEGKLILDDGSIDDNIGIGGTKEFIFLNRFTPDASEFPLSINEVRVYFSEIGLVKVGDDIIIVVYENNSGNVNPGVGSKWLYSYPTTVRVLNDWNMYKLPTPVLLSGPGDVLVGVIAMKTPMTSYWPASIDQTETEQRSWGGWWLSSPPPTPQNLPPDSEWYVYSGNWMIRAYYSAKAPQPGDDDDVSVFIQCFIATEAFGSPLAGQVEILRQFRDRYLLTTRLGRKFVAWYYRNGPIAADFIKDKPLAKAAVRVALYPLIGFSFLLISGYLPFVIVGLLLSMLIFSRLRPKKLSATQEEKFQ